MIAVRYLRRAACIGLLAASAPGAHEPFFQRIPRLPGGSWAEARGVSGDGSTVVGLGESSWADQFDTEAWVWTARDGIIGLGDLGGWENQSKAYGASFDGSVVVGGARSDRGYEPFRWTREGMVSLGDLPGGDFGGVAHAVSYDGSVIVGVSDAHSGPHAFRWTQETGMVDLGLLPFGIASDGKGVSADGSVVVGVASAYRDWPDGVAFRWTEAEGMIPLGVLPGADYSQAYAVSADGSVVVGVSPGPTPGSAFRWTEAEGMTALGSIPDERPGSGALAVSGDGSIVVGRAGSWTYGVQAFIWDETHGMRSLERVLIDDYKLDLGGVHLKEATGISADGLTFVGNSTRGAWIAHVPEPTALALMLVGAGVVIRRGAGRRQDSSGTRAARPDGRASFRAPRWGRPLAGSRSAPRFS